jgi:hypothetical protein
MAADDTANDASAQGSFLGTGWSFPPRFELVAGAISSELAGAVAMTSDRADIEASLRILFGTAAGERFLVPKYGLDLHPLLFDSVSTTTKTALEDRIRTAILVHEPRINLLGLVLDVSRQHEGVLHIQIEYAIRATNSRYNLVFPFYTRDGNELRGALGLAGT